MSWVIIGSKKYLFYTWFAYLVAKPDHNKADLDGFRFRPSFKCGQHSRTGTVWASTENRNHWLYDTLETLTVRRKRRNRHNEEINMQELILAMIGCFIYSWLWSIILLAYILPLHNAITYMKTDYTLFILFFSQDWAGPNAVGGFRPLTRTFSGPLWFWACIFSDIIFFLP